MNVNVTTDAAHSSMARLFEPRSVALVGASERSLWSNQAYDNLKRFGFPGKIHLINPKGGTIYGQEAATSCAVTGEQIDVALLMVPESAMDGVLADLALAGVQGAVTLSAGFAELGEEGDRRQRRLVELARRSGIRMLGPNCLGYVNFLARTPVWTNQVRRPMANPTVAVVSQSGATAHQIAQFAYQQRVALTHMISTGNEADVDIADAISYLARKDEVRAIALFMESARDPGKFIAAVREAQGAGKPVVVLKVGASAAAAEAARAHTGSLVGDDRVFSAVCRMLGMPRVDSIEDLVTVTDLIARVGPVAVDGLALVGMSGGMCEIATDNAEAVGVPFAKLSPETHAELRSFLPEMVTPGNPLDTTGAAMLKLELLEKSIATIAKDPGVGLVVQFFDSFPDRKTAGIGPTFLERIGEGFRQGGKPALMVSHGFTPVTGDARALAEEAGITYAGCGLSAAIRAIGHLFRWSATQRRPAAVPGPVATTARRPVTEREVLAFLDDAGVPVIPGVLTTRVEEAIAAAAQWSEPAVLKIHSPDIAHKTEVGGVALNLSGAEAVGAAWEAMMACVGARAPHARIDGIVVSPMRQGGIELFVGTVRDPQWGAAIAVGLGGVFVEALKDTSLRMLPVSAADVLEMFDELRGKALLDGFRGAPAIDRAEAARVIAAIGDAALTLGDDLVSLEINPLLAVGGRMEALDGLAVWADDKGSAGLDR